MGLLPILSSWGIPSIRVTSRQIGVATRSAQDCTQCRDANVEDMPPVSKVHRWCNATGSIRLRDATGRHSRTVGAAVTVSRPTQTRRGGASVRESSLGRSFARGGEH
jgi:hypothetical protein